MGRQAQIMAKAGSMIVYRKGIMMVAETSLRAREGTEPMRPTLAAMTL